MQVTACSNNVLSTKHYYLSSFCFEGLIDVTLVDEDAFWKVVNVGADVKIKLIMRVVLQNIPLMLTF